MCSWTKEYADNLKEEGYFDKIHNFYDNEENLIGLYYYLLNRKININCLGDAPSTKMKDILLENDVDETEQFFIDLKNHPCKYWTSSMIKELFELEFGAGSLIDNKKFKYHMNNLSFNVPNFKMKGKTLRVKTFVYDDAIKNNDDIRNNISDNWDVTTKQLTSEKKEIKKDGILF